MTDSHTSMNCQELVQVVTDYLEGKLSEPDRLRFERHLSSCIGCTHYLEQMRQTIRLVGNLREERLTPRQRDELLTLFHDWKNA